MKKSLPVSREAPFYFFNSVSAISFLFALIRVAPMMILTTPKTIEDRESAKAKTETTNSVLPGVKTRTCSVL